MLLQKLTRELFCANFNWGAVMLTVVVALIAFVGLCFLLWVFVYHLVSPLYEIRAALINKKILRDNIDIESMFKVTIIIPCWNEAVGIKNTLRSVLDARYSNLEILVVDDGSKDNIITAFNSFFIEEFLPKYKTPNRTLKLLCHDKNKGKGEALNTGIKGATGDIVITVDGDTVFESDTTYNLVKYFVNPKIDAVEGNIKVSNTRTVIGLLQKIEYQNGVHSKRANSILGCEYVIPGAVAAFRKNVFETVGLLNSVCKTEDLEFTFRLRKHGYNVFFAEDAIVWTEGASDLKGLTKQRLRWKKGRLDTMLLHKDMIFSRKKGVNKMLTHFVLPLILIFDLSSLLLPFSFTLSILWLSANKEPIYVLSWLIITSIITYIPILFGKDNKDWRVVLLSPFFFMLYYVVMFIETYTLVRSWIMIFMNKDVVWQNWQRKGVYNV